MAMRNLIAGGLHDRGRPNPPDRLLRLGYVEVGPLRSGLFPFETILLPCARSPGDVQHDVSGLPGLGGYACTEWGRHEMRFGQDNDGNRWSTSRRQGFEMTTVTPPER